MKNYHSIDRAISQLSALWQMELEAECELAKSLLDDSTASAEEIRKLNNRYEELKSATQDAENTLKQQIGNNYTLGRLFPDTTATCRNEVVSALAKRISTRFNPFETVFPNHPLLTPEQQAETNS